MGVGGEFRSEKRLGVLQALSSFPPPHLFLHAQIPKSNALPLALADSLESLLPPPEAKVLHSHTVALGVVDALPLRVGGDRGGGGEGPDVDVLYPLPTKEAVAGVACVSAVG